MPKVTVKINKKSGNIVTDFEGFQGSACISTAEAMLRGLKAKGVEVHMDTFHSKTDDQTVSHFLTEVSKQK